MAKNDLFQNYQVAPELWDEMRLQEGTVRQHYDMVVRELSQLPPEALHRKEELAKQLFMNQGITFTVYFENEGIERIFPFDIIPRIIVQSEWLHIEQGIKQRLRAKRVAHFGAIEADVQDRTLRGDFERLVGNHGSQREWRLPARESSSAKNRSRWWQQDRQ